MVACTAEPDEMGKAALVEVHVGGAGGALLYPFGDIAGVVAAWGEFPTARTGRSSSYTSATGTTCRWGGRPIRQARLRCHHRRSLFNI